MNGVILIEANSLTSNRLALMANNHDVDIEILAKLMELARYIGGRGREGHAVGALFAIGSVPKLRRYSTALVLNPFKGHSDNKRIFLTKIITRHLLNLLGLMENIVQ